MLQPLHLRALQVLEGVVGHVLETAVVFAALDAAGNIMMVHSNFVAGGTGQAICASIHCGRVLCYPCLSCTHRLPYQTCSKRRRLMLGMRRYLP
jgi:hypothetical protein